MNSIISVALVAVVVILVACVLYLVHNYRLLLDKYADISIKSEHNEITKKIQNDVDRFVTKKTDYAIASATEEAVMLIAKNAENVAKSMRKKTIDKLQDEEKGQERAVSDEFDSAKLEIDKYKEQKFTEIKSNANQILSKLVKEVLSESLDEQKQEALVLKALEDAKKSNIF
ncbi:hypothetical protein BH10PAT1_BH10PAT1_1830 [soil metagenome]